MLFWLTAQVIKGQVPSVVKKFRGIDGDLTGGRSRRRGPPKGLMVRAARRRLTEMPKVRTHGRCRRPAGDRVHLKLIAADCWDVDSALRDDLGGRSRLAPQGMEGADAGP